MRDRTPATVRAPPSKHVILLIGENRTFDHVFATYTPPRGQSVENLLSEGIVKADGTAGANVAKAEQWQASDNRHLQRLSEAHERLRQLAID